MKNKEASTTKGIIVVVDDRPDDLKSLQDLLEVEGYEVIPARNGDECLKKIKGKKADLFLMDIMMPGTVVKKVVKKLKAKVIYVSVVQLTDKEMKKVSEEFKNVVGFIEKPYNIHDVVNLVKKALNSP